MELKKYLENLIKRTLYALIIFFGLAIALKSDDFYLKTRDFLFAHSLDFAYIKSKTNRLLGKYFTNETQFVSSEKLNYKRIDAYHDSYKLTTDYNYIINNLASGVVIYIGEKEDLGMTVVIAADSGINYWYSHIENINVNNYDYVSAGTIIGSTKDNYCYLTFEENGTYLSYENFI